MSLIKIVAAAVFSFVAFSSPLEDFSVSKEEMASFVRQCVQVPSKEQMESEIQTLLAERRKSPKPDWKKSFLSLFGSSVPTTGKIPMVSLDGLVLTEVSPYDLDVITRLTMHRDAVNPFWMKDYKLERKRANGLTQIRRSCLSITCKEQQATTPFQLTEFNGVPPCSDAMCAAQRVFGERQGTQILWAFLKHGANMSPYSDINADPEGMSDETLTAVFAAVDALPEHLRARAVQDSGFFRFKKGKTLAMYGTDSVIANANGALFDPIDHLNLSEKIYILIHELGHRSGYLEYDNLAESREWRQLTGWRTQSANQGSTKRKDVNTRKDGWVSEYAKENANEDFAETFSLYRFNPQRLMRISPERYAFMRDRVFNQIEYDQNLYQGQTQSQVQSEIKSERAGTVAPSQKKSQSVR